MYARDEDEDLAQKELRRIDHLLFVTLKYTRTVDVIRSIIEKYINTINYKVEDYYRILFEKGKIKNIPPAPIMKIKQLEQIHPKDDTVKDIVDFYMMLKMTINAEYRSKEEYRKNVTLVTKDREINIATLKDYVEIVKEQVVYIDQLTQ
jgi:hypothetical protein